MKSAKEASWKHGNKAENCETQTFINKFFIKGIKNKKASREIFLIERICFSLEACEHLCINRERGSQYKYEGFLFGYLICSVGCVFSSPHAASTVVYLWTFVKLTLVKNSRKERDMKMLQNIKKELRFHAFLGSLDCLVVFFWFFFTKKKKLLVKLELIHLLTLLVYHFFLLSWVNNEESCM